MHRRWADPQSPGISPSSSTSSYCYDHYLVLLFPASRIWSNTAVLVDRALGGPTMSMQNNQNPRHRRSRTPDTSPIEAPRRRARGENGEREVGIAFVFLFAESLGGGGNGERARAGFTLAAGSLGMGIGAAGAQGPKKKSCIDFIRLEFRVGEFLQSASPLHLISRCFYSRFPCCPVREGWNAKKTPVCGRTPCHTCRPPLPRFSPPPHALTPKKATPAKLRTASEPKQCYTALG